MKVEGFSGRILVPVDGSRSSLMASEMAAKIAKKTGAAVTSLHVLQELNIGYRLPRNIHDEILDSIEQHANEIETRALAIFKEEKVKAGTRRVTSTDPADSILTMSEKDHDLIVMGASGENMTDPYALGGVTKKVVRHTKCPTLIVKEVSPLSKLLACTDGSNNAVNAVNFAIELAKKMGSSITLLGVVERRIYDYSHKTAKEIGGRVLSNTMNALGKTKLKIGKKVAFGSPSDTIAKLAEKGEHDLIVMGHRGLGTVDRFLIGSVSDHVSNKAKCSVLIVPAKA
jgi:nucleotide-binding universal stress UspA family protein